MKDTLIAITSYNQINYTKSCFESLLPFDDGKVICIDDASDDDVQNLCLDYRVEFFGRKIPRGLTYSWNFAYRYFINSNYKYLIISNNDVLIPNNSINEVTKVLNQCPYVGILTRYNEAGVWAKEQSVETFYDIESSFVDDYKNFQLVQDKILENPKPPIEIDIVYGFCFGLSREIQLYSYSKKNLFNPQNLSIAQEQDLASRVPKSLLCRSAFVYHYKAASFGLSHIEGSDLRNSFYLYRRKDKLLSFITFFLTKIVIRLKRVFKKLFQFVK